MVKPQQNCAGCKFWSARDRTLDGGREIMGTCNRFLDFAKVVYEETRAAAYQEGDLLRRMRDRLKSEPILLQVAGDYEGDAHAYVRTTATAWCSMYESKVRVEQPSLTENSVTT